MTKVNLLILLAAAGLVAAGATIGCTALGGDDDSGQTAAEASTIEQDFLTTVDDMRTAVAGFANAGYGADGAVAYHDRMDQDISALDDLWGQMRSQCDQFSDVCPIGGGATGEQDNQCMEGGHMMDQGRMGQLRGMIDSCRGYLDDFWMACGSPWGQSCSQTAEQHGRLMSDALDRMRGDCRDWWDDGGMMNGGQWGDCGDDDHHGGMMDDDHHGGMHG